ncbi:MAG: VWA domain-containing protein [Bacteroidetes bacterium]|nr:VWA domain-containing protein [Bacteroidota bacterium]MDA0979977.1 VWA domain-containing protein [Bacteroidota bacterium]
MFPKPTYNCFSALSLFAFAIFSVCLAAPFSAQTNAATLTVESSIGNEASDDGPTRILFVFDASNSMNAFWSGERKMALATRLLSKSLASLYGTTDLELGLRAYGHGTKHIEGQQDCDDTELIVPINKGTNLIIKQELGRLKAQGTTPIARSLEKSAGDFSSEPGRNIIILITDGIEACDEDPCAVSRMLQSKGIVVKPFIIGIGIDDKHKESLRCVGNFYDATNPEVFETVLGLVLEQALHNTTVEVRLLDEEGNPTVTDVPMSFTDLRSGAHHPQVVHTLSFNNLTDTFYLDPIPTYSLKLHTLPNRGMDSIQLSPGRHNIISVPDMEQGVISPQFPSSKRNAYNNLGVDVYESGACKSLYSIAIGESVTVLTGTYDLVFHTSPLTYVYDVIVEEDVPTNITIAAPGSFMLQSNASGFGSIVDANTLEHVIQLPSGNPSGSYTLQPGTYTIIFRARRARSSKYSIQSTFTITSGSTLNLNLHD